MAEHPIRGVVYRMDLGHGAKPWLVVSNNHRNRALDTVVVVRVTTTNKPLPTRVDLAHDDPLAGQVLCDDVEQVYADELGERLGALSRSSMGRVGEGLRLALDR
ncbi:MAG: type II toxin-antitoxin system PemK/MazF family toxin [Nocardioidaceae bacterium]